MFVKDGEKNNVWFHAGQEKSKSSKPLLPAIPPVHHISNPPGCIITPTTVDKSLLAPLQRLIKNIAWTTSPKTHYGCSQHHHPAKEKTN